MNSDPPSPRQLEHSHTHDGIRRRLDLPRPRSYLRDAIYGAIDGAVTTFAIVAGVSGGGLSAQVVIILGVANLIGDGFSMAAANFLGTRAENQRVAKLRAIEKKHIAECAEGEREEVRQILGRQGYSGDLLEATLAHITADEERWLKTMLEFEYGVSDNPIPPLPAALATFLSFLLVGSLPLLPFVVQLAGANVPAPFAMSGIMTATAFFTVGSAKSKHVDQHWFWSGIETLAVGAVAAVLAYLVGYLLSGLDYHDIE